MMNELFKLKIFTDAHCVICWDQIDVTTVNGTKSINPLRAGFKTTVKMFHHRLIQLAWISSRQLIMWLSSVCGLHVPVYTPNNIWTGSWWVSGWCSGVLLPDLDQGVSELLDSLWWYLVALIYWYITSHRCSIGFRSEEREGQSMASMSSSCRICRHILTTWGWALSCTRRIWSWNLTAVR